MWVDGIKQHINAEPAYSPAMKEHLCGLVDSTPTYEPVAFLDALIGKINSSAFRSAELAKCLHRVQWQFTQERKPEMDLPAQQTLLENIISGKR